jgi:methyl-accepting chemotaxis protein
MPKISRVRRFEEWGWIVGTGVYVDEAVREKLAETTSSVAAPVRFSISRSTPRHLVPRMVMHPIRPELEGQLDRPEFGWW